VRVDTDGDRTLDTLLPPPTSFGVVVYVPCDPPSTS